MIRLAAFLMLLAGPALAHEWYTGQRNEDGASCCGGHDCGPINPAAVRMISPTRWEVTVQPDQIGTYRGRSEPIVLVFEGNPGNSPDGQFHVCATSYDIGNGVARCLFVGGSM